MKFKFKELIRNKWGWYGAGIYSALVYLLLKYFTNSTPPNYVSAILFPLKFVAKLYAGVSHCNGLECLAGLWVIFIAVPVIGFIAGLILNKIYKKVK